jgi:hypothetical protein
VRRLRAGMLLERARREVRSNGRQAPGEKKVKNTLGHKRADSLVEKMQELWDKKKGRTYGALSRGQRKKQGGQTKGGDALGQRRPKKTTRRIQTTRPSAPQSKNEGFLKIENQNSALPQNRGNRETRNLCSVFVNVSDT